MLPGWHTAAQLSRAVSGGRTYKSMGSERVFAHLHEVSKVHRVYLAWTHGVPRE
jgi:hypothetical protein